MYPERPVLTQSLRRDDSEIHACQEHQKQADRKGYAHGQCLNHAIFFALLTKQQSQRAEETEDDAGQHNKDEDFDQHGVHKKVSTHYAI